MTTGALDQWLIDGAGTRRVVITGDGPDDLCACAYDGDACVQTSWGGFPDSIDALEELSNRIEEGAEYP